MSQHPSIAVVIPAYRVERWITDVIRGVPDLVFRIIVVDDASPDGTAGAVADLHDPRVELVRHPTNLGVGGAVLTGYRIALERGAQIVVKLDGDGQMDPTAIARLVRPIVRGEADYTKGNRFVHGKELRQMPFVRRLGNTALSFLTKAASGYWEVFDPTNGYTAIHAAALAVLDTERVHKRWLFETSMLMELYFAGAVVRDVHIPARYGDEISSLSPGKALVQFPPRLISALFRRLWLRYFIIDFSPVAIFSLFGGILVLFGLIWGIWHFIEVGQTGEPATTGTVMIAVLPLILGAQLLLQAMVLDIQGSPKIPLSSEARRDDMAMTEGLV